jgi:hypothetical protein
MSAANAVCDHMRNWWFGTAEVSSRFINLKFQPLVCKLSTLAFFFSTEISPSLQLKNFLKFFLKLTLNGDFWHCLSPEKQQNSTGLFPSLGSMGIHGRVF